MSNPRQGSNYLRSTYNTRYKGASIHDEIPSSVDPEEAFIIRHNAAIMDKQSHSSNIHALNTIHVQTLGQHPHQLTRNRFMFVIPVNPMESCLRGEQPMEIKRFLYVEFLSRAAIVVGQDVNNAVLEKQSVLMPFHNILFVPFWRADGHHHDEVVVVQRHEKEDRVYSLVKLIKKSAVKRPDYTEARQQEHEAVAVEWAGPQVDPCFVPKVVEINPYREPVEEPKSDNIPIEASNERLESLFHDASNWSAVELRNQRATYLQSMTHRRNVATSASLTPEDATRQVLWTKNQQYSGVLPAVPELQQQPPPKMVQTIPSATEDQYARVYSNVADDAVACNGNPKVLSGTISLYDRLLPGFLKNAGFVVHNKVTPSVGIMAVTPDVIQPPQSSVTLPSFALSRKVEVPPPVVPKAQKKVCRATLDKQSMHVTPLLPLVPADIQSIPFNLIYKAHEHRMRVQDCHMWPLLSVRYNCEKAPELANLTERRTKVGSVAITWLIQHGEQYRRRMEKEPISIQTKPYQYIVEHILPLAAKSAKAPLPLDFIGELAQVQLPPVGLYARYETQYPSPIDLQAHCYSRKPATPEIRDISLYRYGELRLQQQALKGETQIPWTYGKQFPEGDVNVRKWQLEMQTSIRLTENTALWLLQQVFSLFRTKKPEVCTEHTRELEVLDLIQTHEVTLQLLVLYVHYTAQIVCPKEYIQQTQKNTVSYHNVTTQDIYAQALLVAERVRRVTVQHPNSTVLILPLLADMLASAVLSTMLVFYSQMTTLFPLYVNEIIQNQLDDTLSKAIDDRQDKLLLVDSALRVVGSTLPKDTGLCKGGILAAKDQRIQLETICVGVERQNQFLCMYHDTPSRWEGKKSLLKVEALLDLASTVRRDLLAPAFLQFHKLLVIFSPIFAMQIGEEGLFSAGLPQNMMSLQPQIPKDGSELTHTLSSFPIALLRVCDVRLNTLPIYALSPTYASFTAALFDVALAQVCIQTLGEERRQNCLKQFKEEEEQQWKYAQDVISAFISIYTAWKEYEKPNISVNTSIAMQSVTEQTSSSVCLPFLRTKEVQACVEAYGTPDIQSSRLSLTNIEAMKVVVSSSPVPVQRISTNVLQRKDTHRVAKFKAAKREEEARKTELDNLKVPSQYLTTEETIELQTPAAPTAYTQDQRRMNRRVERKLQVLLDKHSGLITDKKEPQRHIKRHIEPIPHTVHVKPSPKKEPIRNEFYRLMQKHSSEAQHRPLNTRTSVLLEHVQK